MAQEARFWEAKTLAEMTRAEWERLCDGCGRCCLHKLRDGDGAIHFTNVACRLLDGATCGCRQYAERARHVPDCVRLTPDNLAGIDWLPPTCAYRLLSEGKALPSWHKLVSEDPDRVHAVGISVRGRTVDERHAGPLEHHVVDWPDRPAAVARVPRQRR